MKIFIAKPTESAEGSVVIGEELTEVLETKSASLYVRRLGDVGDRVQGSKHKDFFKQLPSEQLKYRGQF
ncbi:hypothetical protein A3SI_14074 [Nitritalea halalkaliphila LW7]|uniref:Uncharacterized protein n=1 Tax=Nitritalea halalkaliphila LW7 TaxID=1189621 RepID=I5C0A0_9BACT|nr:hypothetical protein A3SI_14074 [Nitritalea halalkaliphila LW7]